MWNYVLCLQSSSVTYATRVSRQGAGCWHTCLYTRIYRRDQCCPAHTATVHGEYYTRHISWFFVDASLPLNAILSQFSPVHIITYFWKDHVYPVFLILYEKTFIEPSCWPCICVSLLPNYFWSSWHSFTAGAFFYKFLIISNNHMVAMWTSEVEVTTSVTWCIVLKRCVVTDFQNNIKLLFR